MFTLSQVLIDHQKEARNAWAKGAPKAESIVQARQSWAPYLDNWAQYLESNFFNASGFRTGRERVGWIDEASFWGSFWRGYLRDPKMQKPEQARMSLRPYIEGAATAASVSFFKTAPQEAHEHVRACLSEAYVLSDPSVLTWLNGHWTDGHRTVKAQRDEWNRLEWCSSANPLLAQGRGACTGPQLVDLAARALESGLIDQDQQLRFLGHVMLALDEEPTIAVMARLDAALDEDNGLGQHLALVALCSGWNVDKSPRGMAIARLGRQVAANFPLGGVDGMGGVDGKGGPDADLFALINTFEEVRTPLELYRAIVTLGLYQRGFAQPAMDIDGALFAQGTLCQQDLP